MRIGILTSGGPAPGFNGVIESVTQAANRRGWTVLGIPRGYSRLISEDLSQVQELNLGNVGSQPRRGGSMVGTNRANPRKSADAMAAVERSIETLGLDALVTIGGDDTATAAMSVGEALAAKGKDFRVAHVPKTIDNDLPLPGNVPTFGFETAKDLGATLAANLREDALTTGRWYLVTAMGRSAGHLALGIATGANADLCLIREEFPESQAITVADLISRIARAIEIREAQGQEGGLVVLGEGILERLDPQELASIATLELDEHGNPRMSEVDLGKALAQALNQAGNPTKFVTKLLGYELRCADPIAYDVQYTRNLGVAAVDFLAEGTGNGIVCVVEDQARILRFEELKDAETDRVPVRRVNVEGMAWKASLQLQARD